MNRKIIGLILVVLSYAPLGASYPIVSGVTAKVPVMLFTCLSFIISAVIAIPLALKFEPEVKWREIDRSTWVKIGLSSLLGVFLFTVTNIWGLSYCEPVTASVITSVEPALVMFFAFFILNERVTVFKIVGIVASVIAVMVMSIDFSGTAFEDYPKMTLGIILMFCSVACYIVYMMAEKKLAYDMPPLTMTVFLVTPTAIMTIPFGVHDMMSFDLGSLTGIDWAAMVYYGAIVGYWCYMSGYWSLSYLPASIVSMGAGLVPIAAAAVAVIGYGSTLSMKEIVCIIVICVAICVISMTSNDADDTRLSEPKEV